MLAMAVTTLLTISCLVLLQVAQTPDGQNAGGYGPAQMCSSQALDQIWSNLPGCRPREELVKLPLPSDETVLEVIPSHVLVNRCAGVCHNENMYHKCVPTAGTKSQQSFEVSFRKTTNEMDCTSISIEVHNNCECGCDVEASNCNDKQTYDEHFCKCRCQNVGERHRCLRDLRRKFWDDASCRCLCRPEEYRECSTGFVYDPIESCDCHERLINVGATTTASIAGIAIVTSIIVAISVASLWLMRSNRRLRRRLRWMERRQAGSANTNNGIDASQDVAKDALKSDMD